jgi:hypothetical protein
VDPSGSLRVAITAATGFDGFPIAIRRLRIGPSQNAAVTIGPHVGRSDPFYYELIGVQETSFTATRVTPGQPLHIPLIVFDDCEDWRTFVGAGTGVALPAVVATATTVPCAAGQVCGTIPISMFASDTVFGPGTRVRVTIDTRQLAACELRVTYPGQPQQSLGAMTANSNGDCIYNLFVPFNVVPGNGSFMGIVQDAFGTNVEVVSFRIGSPTDDNNAVASAEAAVFGRNSYGNSNEDDNADNDE